MAFTFSLKNHDSVSYFRDDSLQKNLINLQTGSPYLDLCNKRLNQLHNFRFLIVKNRINFMRFNLNNYSRKYPFELLVLKKFTLIILDFCFTYFMFAQPLLFWNYLTKQFLGISKLFVPINFVLKFLLIQSLSLELFCWYKSIPFAVFPPILKFKL